MRTTVAAAALALTLVAGCAGPSTSPSPTLPPTPTASPPPTASPAPTATITFPTPVEVEPAAVIDVSGSGTIALVTDGQTLWAGATGALLRIDVATNAVESFDAPLARDDTTLALADDGLWATLWGGGRLYRLDPATGAVLLEVEMPSAVRIAFVGEDLWVGQESLGSMTQVDRVTGEISSNVVSKGAYGTSGMGDLWFTSGSLLKVLRVDPATGEEKATIEFAGETNCSLFGSFPDNVWTACFGRDVIARSASRIDPITNTVATVAMLPPSHGGSVILIDGQPWFVGTFEGSDRKPVAGLLRIDPLTGSVDRFITVAGVDSDLPVVTGNALWLADEAGSRILRIDLADLAE